MKYSEALVAGEAKLEAALVPHKVKQTQKSAEIEVSKLEESLATHQVTLARAEAAFPFSITAVLNAEDQIALCERKIKQAQAVLVRLF